MGLEIQRRWDIKEQQQKKLFANRIKRSDRHGQEYFKRQCMAIGAYYKMKVGNRLQPRSSFRFAQGANVDVGLPVYGS